MIDAVLQLAKKELGVREEGGNNRGSRVEAYLSAVGLGAGNPWCAAFVCWVMKSAGVKGFPMTGDTWELEAWAEREGILVNNPMAGDVFLLLDAQGKPMHTGFVAGVSSSMMIDTIEGNTGVASDTDGDGVARKSRLIRGCRYIRWSKALAKPPRIMYDGREILCHPAEELGVTRVDLRSLCKALGFSVDAQNLEKSGEILLRKVQP